MAAPLLQSFSFLHDLLNYSTAVFWFFAYVALLRQVHKEQNAYGLSFQTLFALVVVEASNVLLIICLLVYYNKRVHSDFFTVDCPSAMISICVFVYVYRNFRSTYEKQRDTFGQKYLRLMKIPQLFPYYHVLFLYGLSFALAMPMFLWRRSPYVPSLSEAAWKGNGRLIGGMLLSFWECFNDSVLALALLPQLFMFYNRRPRKVTSLLGTFVAFLFFARTLAFIYWVTFPLFHVNGPPGMGIHCVTEGLNILILLDFLYYYIKAKLSGQEDIALPI